MLTGADVEPEAPEVLAGRRGLEAVALIRQFPRQDRVLRVNARIPADQQAVIETIPNQGS